MVNVLKFRTLYYLSFLIKWWLSGLELNKTLVRMGNREDPDQTASQKQSDLGLSCLSRADNQCLKF